jgi:hypothetical protein
MVFADELEPVDGGPAGERFSPPSVPLGCIRRSCSRLGPYSHSCLCKRVVRSCSRPDLCMRSCLCTREPRRPTPPSSLRSPATTICPRSHQHRVATPRSQPQAIQNECSYRETFHGVNVCGDRAPVGRVIALRTMSGLRGELLILVAKQPARVISRSYASELVMVFGRGSTSLRTARASNASSAARPGPMTAITTRRIRYVNSS